jgi:hypothetical protein
VLLWFDDSITQTIAENGRAAVAQRQEESRRLAAAVAPASTTAEPVIARRQERVEQETCLIKLQTYEQSGGRSVQLPCGATSGTTSCGRRCQSIGERITQVQKEIAGLDKQVAAAQLVDAQSAKRRQDELDRIDARAGEDSAAIAANFSDDYLARVTALEQLKERSAQVEIVELFMIALFVCVDILPLTMKLSTSMGEYEYVRDTMLLQGIATESARQSVVRSGKREYAAAEVRADVDLVVARVDQIARVPMQILQDREAHMAEFEKAAQRLRRHGTRSKEAKLALELEIRQLRERDAEVWEATMAHAQEFLKRA